MNEDEQAFADSVDVVHRMDERVYESHVNVAEKLYRIDPTCSENKAKKKILVALKEACKRSIAKKYPFLSADYGWDRKPGGKKKVEEASIDLEEMIDEIRRDETLDEIRRDETIDAIRRGEIETIIKIRRAEMLKAIRRAQDKYNETTQNIFEAYERLQGGDPMTAFTVDGKFIADTSQPGHGTFNSNDNKVTAEGVWDGPRFMEGLFTSEGHSIEGKFEGGVDGLKPTPIGECRTIDVRQIDKKTEHCEATGSYVGGVRHGQFDCKLIKKGTKGQVDVMTLCHATFEMGRPMWAIFRSPEQADGYYEGDFELDDDGFIIQSGRRFKYSNEDWIIPHTVGLEHIYYKRVKSSDADGYITVGYKPHMYYIILPQTFPHILKTH